MLKVDNVNLVTGAKDVFTHLRVPVTGLVSEVRAGLKQVAHADFGHNILLGLSHHRPHQSTRSCGLLRNSRHPD
jgi:hypothetical protein